MTEKKALPVRHIMIKEQELHKLDKNIWSNAFIAAEMAVGGKRFEIKLRYRGGHTREYPKRSYEIVREGRTYHYNAEYDDPSLIRNALSFQYFRSIGVPSPRTKHCLLLLNGRSLGVYLEIEAVDRRFFAARRIPVQSLFYAVNNAANFGLVDPDYKRLKKTLMTGYKQMLGGEAERRRLMLFIRKLNRLKGRSLQKWIRSRMDVDHYLRWLAGAVLTGNYDGFTQNYAIYEHKRTRKYRMIPWDYEGTWGRNCYGKPCGSKLVSVRGYNRLTRKILLSKSAQSRYKRLLQRLLRSSFTVQKLGPSIDQLHNSIQLDVYRDVNRKGSALIFDDEPRFIRAYIRERRAAVREDMRKL